jgi:hypothetical protein
LLHQHLFYHGVCWELVWLVWLEQRVFFRWVSGDVVDFVGKVESNNGVNIAFPGTKDRGLKVGV